MLQFAESLLIFSKLNPHPPLPFKSFEGWGEALNLPTSKLKPIYLHGSSAAPYYPAVGRGTGGLLTRRRFGLEGQLRIQHFTHRALAERPGNGRSAGIPGSPAPWGTLRLHVRRRVLRVRASQPVETAKRSCCSDTSSEARCRL